MSADNIYNTPVSINLNTILAANPNGGTVLVAIPGTPITMVFDLDVTNQACYPGGLAGDIVLDDNVICNNEFLAKAISFWPTKITMALVVMVLTWLLPATITHSIC